MSPSLPAVLPQLLIVDDLLGRTHPDRRNEERASFCGQFLIEDLTGDEVSNRPVQRIQRPVAQAVFCRGQTPGCATVGDLVENDLDGTLRVVRDGWFGGPRARTQWAMVLLDLCFYTGRVTLESQARTPGVPEGRPGDDDPRRYFGLDLLDVLHERFPDLPVVILSGKPREPVSRVFAQRGALGFLPRHESRSLDLLREYIRRHGLIPDESGAIVGRSRALLLTLRSARRAALDRRNVLIEGERGTGKELLARFLHRQGPSPEERPFVSVDAGALSPQLYASELFGHVRGAFTGADRDRTGRIVQADGGDLFLDEIGNMPADVQTGLLRVLEQREVSPLGALQWRKVDVRFISATNETLGSQVAFRSDLLDRLREAGVISLPPLRERLEDLDLLVECLTREAERVVPGALRRRVEPEVLDCLRAHDWPGNIRELRSCLFNAVFSYPDVEHLVPVHLNLGPGRGRAMAPLPPEVAGARSGRDPASSLDALLSAMAAFRFDDIDPEELRGTLPRLQKAYTHLVAGLFTAGLRTTSRSTLDRPTGKPLIHPTAKLLTGNGTLSGSQAADLTKRHLGPLLKTNPAAEVAPILEEAYEKARRLRPSGRKKTDAARAAPEGRPGPSRGGDGAPR